MHELSIITNLLKILEKIQKDQKVTAFLNINITINPYSCLDGENLNFIFRSMTNGMPFYQNALIRITRGDDPASREFILNDVEIEVK